MPAIMPSGPANATILVVQDQVDFQDLSNNRPLTGAKGHEFGRMLTDAGIIRSSIFETAFIRDTAKSAELFVRLKKGDIQPGDTNLHDRMVAPEFLDYRSQLLKEISLVKPRVVIVLGNGALFALTGKWGLKSWRGSGLELDLGEGLSTTVVPTYPPDFVQAVWKERQITVSDLRRCKVISESGRSRKSLDYDFTIRPAFNTVCQILDNLLSRVAQGPTKLSVDIETRGGHTACTGIAWSKTQALCIPHIYSGAQNYWTDYEEAFIVHKLYRLLTHPNAIVIGQNFLYDAQYFYRHFHFIPNLVRDTMIAEHSMVSNMPKDLGYLSSKYCEEHVFWKDESKNWDPKVGEDQLWTYNCKDCCITYEVDEAQQSAVDTFTTTGWSQLRAVHDFQQALFWPVLETMIRGVRIDDASRKEISAELGVLIEEAFDWIEQVTGSRLNPRSPKQMQDFFYRQCAQREIKKRSAKGVSITCDDAAMELIGRREPLLKPITDKISDVRSLGVFKSTFMDSGVDIDDRMRCSINIGGTKTYRFSTSQNAFDSGMNMQNIPVGDEDGEAGLELPNVRKAFIPDPDHEFFDIDLDSADLRIVVEEGDVEEMREWLRDGKKPYVEVAKEYYKDPSITKSHPAYKFFKAFSHATHYLGEPGGMADRINQHMRAAGRPSLTITEIQTLQNWYLDKFPGIRHWHETQKANLVSRKYVENILGYRIYYLDRIEGNIFKQAIAAIPQSTVACLINRGYMNLYNNHKEIQVLLQVHDSLAGQFHRDIRDEALANIKKSCEVALPYKNPLIIPVGIKSSPESWGACG